MKKIEYPIKEIVSFEMDENKIWWLKYDEKHQSFPKKNRGKFPNTIFNKKEYRNFLFQVCRYCKEHNFELEGDGMYVSYDWNRTPVKSYPGFFPEILYPFSSPFCREWGTFLPSPYYGNPHYKKYIEDNNGECLLPFPKDMKWWEIN